MHWSDDFIAVDWGTTNRRAYRIAHGACTDEFEDDQGVLAVAAGGFPAAVEAICQRLGERPLLLAGMIGSTRGWIEVPYVACPADVATLAAGLHWVDPGRVAIVPGLSFRDDTHADVMRGEEVQMFGALAAGTVPATGIVCHPGTHNKWISLVDGRVAAFRTVLTGEMFALLRKHSILAEMLGGEVGPGDAFAAGVARGLPAPLLTAELFSVRARVLLGDMEREDAAAFVSGLLIGADIALGQALADGATIHLMGEPELTLLYAAAAAQAGQPTTRIEGRDAFIAGAVALARNIT
jgi:2-dehydro-3-deoxygalactonokinase